MNRILNIVLVILSITGLSSTVLWAQMDNLHGMDSEYRMGVHAGNLFRTTFFNDGTYGGRTNISDQIGGEWPINSGHFYLVDGNIFVGSEVTDRTGNLIHILSENKSANIGGSRGDKDPITGEWWTFLPLPGFANPSDSKIAMSKGSSEWAGSWPAYWPDKYDDPSDPGWRNDNMDKNPSKAAWNGYFGKNIFNADEESYFVADDYNNKEFNFYPDQRDTTRKGLGLRIYVRGFQWAKAAVEDGIFCLYDIKNIGTHLHDKMVFGYKIGNNMGETRAGSDAGDDNAAYNRDLNLAYMWDEDGIGAQNWGPDPVGYMGGAFLESPGNPYDGIDNDNDGKNFPGPTITESMFQPKTLGLNDKIVLINYQTFQRRVTTLADTLRSLGKTDKDTLEVKYLSRVLKFWAGKVMTEVGDNLVDDNLNGLIDENRGKKDAAGVLHYLYVDNSGNGYKYIDYLNPDKNSNGMNNLMMDEKRDDGIDNDGDWDPIYDDTGVDGLLPGNRSYPGPDFGERDGKPTNGEPHFDKTDIHETDMLGLTSFDLYEWSSLNQYDDEAYWNAMAPGLFSQSLTQQNVELLYGSGYFPLTPGQTERISMSIICGADLADLTRNKNNVQLAYDQNYNFSKAPYIPTVRAVGGNNRVTLFWDDFAESSEDPISGKDFEGYRIYRSTDPSWNDMSPITDGHGTSYLTPLFRTPIAQFDLDNNYKGFASIATEGVQFWLGSNTGLRHYWVDTTAVNGFTYYYAVTSYDHGDPTLGIDPSECTKYAALKATGEIERGTNVIVIRPEAPSAGFVDASLANSTIVKGTKNTATGTVGFTILDNTQIKNSHTYQVTFKDTLNANSLKVTQSFTLSDKTSGNILLKDHPLTAGSEGLPMVDGFKLSFAGNAAELNIDTSRSHWNRPGIPNYVFKSFSFQDQPVQPIAGDFEIVFSERGVDTSKVFNRGSEVLPSTPVNFTVINKTANKKVPFAFRKRANLPGTEGRFAYDPTRRRSDEIIFLANPDSQVASWQVIFSPSVAGTDTSMPKTGDVLTLNLNKPFLSHDTFEFTTLAPSVDNEYAKSDLDRIKVVPNPYIVANSWEPKNPYANGRGDRQLHFTHLPQRCQINIYNVKGQLIKSIDHDNVVNDGTEIWNMLSKDNLEISYGIYVYHIKAEGIGEKTGKFVVIK